MIKFVRRWMIGSAMTKLQSVLFCLHEEFNDDELKTLIQAFEVLESKK